MNVTELARILKITPQELRDKLPQFGFDIGQKAIKINKNVASKIIKEWPKIRRRLEEQKELEQKKGLAEKEKVEMKITVSVPQYITVRDFAQITGKPINAILSELMRNSIFSSLNEKIDFDTAWLIGTELGVDVRKAEETSDEEKEETSDEELKKIIGGEKEESLKERPPVIVVMGHVDHGKTRLLDAIRKSNVIEGEAGGITQHIGAYQVIRKNKLITFIDTPGHEAFTAMRSRGARIADIAILVVAADDGVKPQTVEAFRIIEKTKIPFVVAINKIDKPEANIDKTKQELSNQLHILPEDWGGKTICVPVSAMQGTGIPDLLDMVLLAAETESSSLKANPDSPAIGTVIESNVDKGSGPIATILVQNGTLRIGDQITLNGMNIGKVRNINDYTGSHIDEALPSAPAQIIGLKTAPAVGDIIKVGQGEKMKQKKVKGMVKTQMSTHITQDSNDDAKKLNLIIKSDVFGSAEAIEGSLEKINTEYVKAKILHKGLGNITDGDIKQAEASDAIIIGFNVKLPSSLEEVAREKKVEIQTFSIIYDLLNFVKEKMQSMVVAKIVREDIGKAEVLAIFKTTKTTQIIGVKVSSGRITSDSLLEIERKGEKIAKGKINKLQSGKQDVTSVEKNTECGIEFEGNPIVEVGDTLLVYTEEKIIEKI